MLDIRLIRENPELIQKTAQSKGMDLDVSELLKVDDVRRALQQETEDLKRQLNEGNQVIRTLSKEEKPDHIARMKEISQASKQKDEELREIVEQYQALMLRVPSPVSEDTPLGKSDADNVEFETWGKIPEFSFEPKSHVDLGQTLGLMDIERGVKLSGSRFYFLKNEGTLLELAVMRYALDFIRERGFEVFTVPLLVKEKAMTGTGYFPGGEEQAYKMAKDELFLIGTSEVPLASYYCDEILNLEQLPFQAASWSHCFRREAGTYGKDTQGLYRIHQFQKVEQVIVCKNDAGVSLAMHEALLKNARDFLESLEIPYQVVFVCTGDMGQGQVRKYDINSWMPSRNAYGETHSCSMFGEFQARRLNLRYKDEEGTTRFCHTLNNTLVASPRVLIPLLENHQQEDGSVRIPEVLRPYMGGLTALTPK